MNNFWGILLHSIIKIRPIHLPDIIWVYLTLSFFFCVVVQYVKSNKSLGIAEETMVKLENSRISLICYFIIEENKLLYLNDVWKAGIFKNIMVIFLWFLQLYPSGFCSWFTLWLHLEKHEEDGYPVLLDKYMTR